MLWWRPSRQLPPYSDPVGDLGARRITRASISLQASLSAFGFLFAEMVRYYQNRITNLDDLERKCVPHSPLSATPGSCGYIFSMYCGDHGAACEITRWGLRRQAQAPQAARRGCRPLPPCSRRLTHRVPSAIRRLENAGKSVGFKFLELVAHRDRPGRRETKLIGALQFVSSTCFKALFGRVADALEKSTENADECALCSTRFMRETLTLVLVPATADMISDHDPVTNRFISVPRDMGKINCAAYIAGIIEGILAGQGFVSVVDSGVIGVVCVESYTALRSRAFSLRASPHTQLKCPTGHQTRRSTSSSLTVPLWNARWDRESVRCCWPINGTCEVYARAREGAPLKQRRR